MQAATQSGAVPLELPHRASDTAVAAPTPVPIRPVPVTPVIDPETVQELELMADKATRTVKPIGSTRRRPPVSTATPRRPTSPSCTG